MTIFENRSFPSERALYGVHDTVLRNCTFDGEEDGESALKEAEGVKLDGCYMNLRYPLWHDKNAELKNVTMTDKCRAALWYSDGISIVDSHLLGIKALRECSRVSISGTQIVSPEFGWKCNSVNIGDSSIESEYLFLMSKDIKLDKVTFKGKYSFQYVDGAQISSCVLDTKDAFWHARNVTVRDSVIRGEYLAWYSEDLTLINCTVIGTQPFCYCKGLTLIDCEMRDTDLAFEYSDVRATVIGDILSVKNPRSGRIVCDGIGELILTEDSKYASDCIIEQKSAKNGKQS